MTDRACITCSHGALRDRDDVDRDKALRRMAAQRFIACNLSPFKATFRSFTSTCKKFAQADEATAAARVRWAEGQQQ